MLRGTPEEKVQAKEKFKNGIMRFEKHSAAKFFGGKNRL